MEVLSSPAKGKEGILGISGIFLAVMVVQANGGSAVLAIGRDGRCAIRTTTTDQG